MIANFSGFIKHNCHGDDAESLRKKNASTTSFPRSKILGKKKKKEEEANDGVFKEIEFAEELAINKDEANNN